jgi:hypothetical protein
MNLHRIGSHEMGLVMTSPRAFLVALATLVLTTSGVVVNSAPADALAGQKLIGHRCRTYAPAVTNENTVAALVDTARVAGVWCEVDAWTIADGTVIIWHDSTWGRVANHATLPTGVEPSSMVSDATWAQVSKIRTKGGRPVPRLGRMIDVSGQHGVPLLVEIKNSVASPSTWVARAGASGARVRYYQPEGPECRTTVLDRMRAAGARIGLKLRRATPCLTPGEMQARGVSFVHLPGTKVKSAYSEELRAHGIDVYASGADRSNARSLLSKGAARLVVDRPRAARNW